MRLAGHAVEVLTFSLPDRDATLTRQGEQLIDPLAGALFIHKQFEGLATTAQPFTYRVNPV
jgi:hypothetical protein